MIDVCFLWASSVFGSIVHPYEAMRSVVKRSKLLELVPLFCLVLLYVALASIVKIQEFRPFFLTGQFLTLVFWIGVSYGLSVLLLWFVGKNLGGKGTVRSLLVSWGYTLVPTLVWFLVTSILYVVLPPPRTNGVLGIGFSFVYLCFSAAVFLWKGTLVYLSLRFGMRLTLPKILLVLAVFLPLALVYSVFMYRFGIFRVPFL
ncbi:YIP1 family protein [Candidatus Gottesmanbacteria bacterium]|nr:YIP1 family protein [Candidatus Gottesmanbacteria bacterium]